MHDSGNRQEFTTGAVRDTAENKSRPGLISPWFKERLGDWLATGAQKYSDRNWEKGIPVSRSIESLERHLMQFQQGKTDEDHMAAVATNAMFVIHTLEMVQQGVLPAKLDDWPRYEPQKTA